eukprot:COSAG04_NODE_7613_length_1097_cov_2.086172_1_plen_246_part_10
MAIGASNDEVTADVTVAVDNSHDTYCNGALLGSGSNWMQADTWQCNSDTGVFVVGIDARDAELGTNQGVGALIAQVVTDSGTTLVTDDVGWKCWNAPAHGSSPPDSWMQPDFDDSSGANGDTVRLSVQLGADQANMYAIFGDPDSPMSLPPAYQSAAPFGVDIGGVAPDFVALSADAGTDSWLALLSLRSSRCREPGPQRSTPRAGTTMALTGKLAASSLAVWAEAVAVVLPPSRRTAWRPPLRRS